LGGSFDADQEAGQGCRAERACLPGGFFPAAAQDGVQAVADSTGKLEQLAIAIELDRLARRIEDNLAAVTLAKVLFEFPLEARVDFPIQVI
jgi:hypothetical protein